MIITLNSCPYVLCLTHFLADKISLHILVLCQPRSECDSIFILNGATSVSDHYISIES